MAEKHYRQLLRIEPPFLDQPGRFRAGNVEPAVGYMIARQEVADAVVAERPAVADDAHPFKDGMVGSLPIIEQTIEVGNVRLRQDCDVSLA